MLGEEGKVHLLEGSIGTVQMKNGRVPVAADELQIRGTLKIADEGERTAPNFCFDFAKLAVRLTRTTGRHQIQKLVDVMFDIFSHAKELCRQKKRAGDWKRLFLKIPRPTEKGGFQKKN